MIVWKRLNNNYQFREDDSINVTCKSCNKSIMIKNQKELEFIKSNKALRKIYVIYCNNCGDFSIGVNCEDSF